MSKNCVMEYYIRMTDNNKINENIVELLNRIRRGDNDALELLIDLKFSDLYKLAYGYLKDKMLAEDVATETIYKLISEKTGGVRNLGGWMTVIVKNKCLDILKKRKRAVLIEDVQAEIHNNSSKMTLDRLEKIHIEDCLGRLLEKERQMLLLEYHGYTMKESVRLLGITTAQGRRLLKKAKEYFKKEYER